MNKLIAVSFNEKAQAAEVLNKLVGLQQDYLLDLEDAVVVVRDDDGKVRIRQSVNLTAEGAAQGGLWGALIGLILGGPLGMLLAGSTTAVFGAIAGSLSDYGIDDEFIKRVGNELKPGSSALFILLRQLVEDKVLDQLNGVHGQLIKTSLSKDAEERLARILSAPNATVHSAPADAAA
ncbi:DUF1269 domain-containing protein [Spirosoma jeollabukense]